MGCGSEHATVARHVGAVVGVCIVELVVKSETVNCELVHARHEQIVYHGVRDLEDAFAVGVGALGDEDEGPLDEL